MPKRSLIRIVNGPDGVQVDLTGKAHGRGAYLHDRQACWLRGIKGSLDQALRTKLTDQEKAVLETFMETHIPDERVATEGAEGLSG